MENIQTLQQLEHILNQHPDTKPLNFREACKYLGCSASYLYKLTHLQAIPHYKPNGKKIYFSKPELDQYLFRNRIKPLTEIESEASNYVVNGKSKKVVK